ncbi:uncharacterized protein LOC123507197 [Portunus trituberculatus]|uniref:uncharacterized protein LOC123507197 n=1 Tax=Portunus trituberculatus TaxID=210409 RepID=UPI001E1D0B04|nr:uncharacterized protein LOC123507197 [Portunus trituberculatus]
MCALPGWGRPTQQNRALDIKNGGGVTGVRGASVKCDSSHQRPVKKLKKPYNLSDKSDFNWSLDQFHLTVYKQQWDDAFSLLPSVIIPAAPFLSLELLWQVTDVIARNIPSLTADDRKKFRSILNGMKLKPSGFFDVSSQDLTEAMDSDVDELLQMIEDIQMQRLPPSQGIEIYIGKHFKALSDGFCGLVHYHCWKSSLLNVTSSSQPLEDNSCSVNMCEYQGTANTSKKLVKVAHFFLKKAFISLSEPCDWFMLQFLELEKELFGLESAVSALKQYKNYPYHGPVHHLAYQFYKKFVPRSIEEQLMELEFISKAYPYDALVLEEVNLYLHSLEHGGPALERAMMWMRSTMSDSDQESSDNCPSPSLLDNSCLLKTTGKAEVLMRCLLLLIRMLNHQGFTWNLKPWEKLTQVLSKFYQAWIRCWSCVTCIKIRKKVQRIASLVMPLWKCFVWKEPPVILPLEVARILAHHMFAAFIFSNGEYCRTDTISSPITCRLLHTVWLPLCMMFLLWLWG